VRVKLALSLDGRTVPPSDESKWITGDESRADVQTWRARSSAILTGIGTVLADDPRLTVRYFDIGRQPMRVVLDSKLRTPLSAQLLREPGKTLIVTVTQSQKAEALAGVGAEVVVLLSHDGMVDLPALLQMLAQREVNELLVEAGAILCDALLKQNLVDELVLYYAPRVIGERGRGLLDLPSPTDMKSRPNFEVVDTRVFDKDWRIIVKVAGR
jgi:diaminohydroxyphosphoribosylaminopyrimidine deaminase/5-amino-6-(5-phosphoribosylamino)uracil reductase